MMRQNRNGARLAAGFGAAFLTAAGIASAGAQQAIKLTVISGHPPATPGVYNMQKVLAPAIDKELAAEGKYKIEWTMALGGTVAKPPAVFEAIESAIGDIGYVPALFEADKLPLDQVTYVTPFGSTDVTKVIEVMTKLREKVPEMNAAYLKHKQVWLAGIGIDNYQILSKQPIKSLAELKGVKLGAPGLSANWIKNTGAVAVAGNLTLYYNAMRTGVYEGIVVFTSAVTPYKFYEVAPYIDKVDFGATYASALTMNKRRFDGLPKPVQQAILKAAKAYQVAVNQDYADRSAAAMEVAKKAGAKVVDWSLSDRQKLAKTIPNFAKVWAANLDKKRLPGTKTLKAYMELSRAAGINHARAWDKE
ncbi:MAG: C4-dicarboxylate TRAP transporter substrate-binding protein [Beijerinckiaceae bacterium]